MIPRIHVLIENLGEVEPNITASVTRHTEADEPFTVSRRSSQEHWSHERRPFFVSTRRALEPDSHTVQSLTKRIYLTIRLGHRARS
jgi:hypothetical protein